MKQIPLRVGSYVFAALVAAFSMAIVSSLLGHCLLLSLGKNTAFGPVFGFLGTFILGGALLLALSFFYSYIYARFFYPVLHRFSKIVAGLIYALFVLVILILFSNPFLNQSICPVELPKAKVKETTQSYQKTHIKKTGSCANCCSWPGSCGFCGSCSTPPCSSCAPKGPLQPPACCFGCGEDACCAPSCAIPDCSNPSCCAPEELNCGPCLSSLCTIATSPQAPTTPPTPKAPIPQQQGDSDVISPMTPSPKTDAPAAPKIFPKTGVPWTPLVVSTLCYGLVLGLCYRHKTSKKDTDLPLT